MAHVGTRLAPEFFARRAQEVGADLLGKLLVRMNDGQRLSGFIVETEAYCDADEPDLACHGDRANGGRPTERTAVMFGPAGCAYVYFTYGMHWMFNIVTGEPGVANAVLIRALEPDEGPEIMAGLRGGRKRSEWTNGPAKLAQALAIDKSMNGAYLCLPDSAIWLEKGREVTADQVERGPRIGLGNTPEPWLSMPWRYWIRDNPYVSK
ncbi:MAG: DNA-3-methyladenine glycosylase [Chloroflexota bacterium]|nr:MAG: DNA-3-methyladenine glycosylase [Chloroflexota bacterium]